MSNWSERDQKAIWHPFTHLKYAEKNIFVERTEGAFYFDDKGTKILDAISSWWVNLHGHRHPHIIRKIKEQLDKNEHSIFSGFTHEGAIDFAERLLTHLPEGQQKLFYSDNGSTAVEVAVKMCLQYWSNKKINRTRFVAFEGAYHGDTFGGMSVGARNAFNLPFEKLLFDVRFFPPPLHAETIDKDYFDAFEEIVSDQEVAAFIYEPLVQGAAGMRIMNARALNQLLEIAKSHGVFCIADEVMTGFGRTGTFFASDQLQSKPDLLCLSKGITGGFMPLGLTTCTNALLEAFISDNKYCTFFHGHSYTANPLAISAALGSLDLMEEETTWKKIKWISDEHKKQVNILRSHTAIQEIQSLGTILSIQLKTKEKSSYLHSAAENISAYFIEKHILIRPLGNIIYIIPPYCIEREDIDYIYQTIKKFLDDFKD